MGAASAPVASATPGDLEEQLLNALRGEQHILQAGNTALATTIIVADDEDASDNEDDDPGHANEPVFIIPPPPEGHYANEEELEKTIHAWSMEHGYEMVRRASKKNSKKVLYKRYFHCSRHGKIANTGKLTDETRVRSRRKSNRTGCPMSLAAVAVDPANPKGEWQIRHRKTHHNHGPVDALALAGHRRRARLGGVEKAVNELFAIDTPTTQVLQFLQRTNPDGLFTRTDVANMKLKYKKFGTCVKEDTIGQYSTGKQANSVACISCRTRKARCDNTRPACDTCVKANVSCQYEPDQLDDEEESFSIDQPIQASTVETVQSRPRAAVPPAISVLSTTTTEQILANLRAHQSNYTPPQTRLTLNHSSVEILAQSSCGSGDTYKALPTLYIGGDWTSFSQSFLEASLKENTHDVLLGVKPEPSKPLPPASTETEVSGDEAIPIDSWNEYVKQLAIFNRRNSMLLGALWASLAPAFRSRVQGFRKACEVWRALEDMCQPRGSDQALSGWLEVHAITLVGCGGKLREYIGKLESAWMKFTRLKLSPQSKLDRRSKAPSSGEPAVGPLASGTGTGTDVFPEEALCFLFLNNLGSDWSRWVQNLCSSNNVGGFGTGARLGFKDVCQRVLECEAMGRKGQAISGADAG